MSYCSKVPLCHRASPPVLNSSSCPVKAENRTACGLSGFLCYRKKLLKKVIEEQSLDDHHLVIFLLLHLHVRGVP